MKFKKSWVFLHLHFTWLMAYDAIKEFCKNIHFENMTAGGVKTHFGKLALKYWIFSNVKKKSSWPILSNRLLFYQKWTKILTFHDISKCTTPMRASVISFHSVTFFSPFQYKVQCPSHLIPAWPVMKRLRSRLKWIDSMQKWLGVFNLCK